MSRPCAYVVSGGILICDLGCATSNICATHHNRVKITKKNVCNIEDKITNKNIFDFKQCSKTGQSCVPAVTRWNEPAKDRAGKFPMLLVRSFATCSVGGKITVFFSGQSPPGADYDPDSENSIDSLIGLIQKVENANSDWSKEDVLAALRRLGGVDYPKMRDFFGTDPAKEIIPKGDLTETDIELLNQLLLHDVDENGNESGIVIDRQGNPVAISHILTGMESGLHRNNSAKIGKWYEKIPQDSMDNVYATTISGDLGQSAVRVDAGKDVGTGEYTYIGLGTEATDGELNGDLDGMIIGEHLSYVNQGDTIEYAWNNGSVSSFINDYYTNYAGGRYSITRSWLTTSKNGKYFIDQTKRFAANYKFTESYNLFKNLDGDVVKACEEFYDWLNKMLEVADMREVTDGTC